MKSFHLSVFSIIITILFSTIGSFAQNIRPSDYNTWSISLKAGILRFNGDVMQQKYTVDNKYKKTNTGISLEGTKNINQILSIRLGAMSGGLTGSTPNLNLHFESKIQKFVLEGIVNLNDLISFYPKKAKIFNAYMFGGLGVINFRTRLYSYDENTLISTVGWDSTGLSKTNARKEIVIPFGIGIKFKADKQFDFGLEYAMQFTNTDKLDAWMVAKSYMDKFSSISASITYKIGEKAEFVDWVNPFMDTSRTEIRPAQNNKIETSKNPESTKTGNLTKTNPEISTAPVADYYIIAATYSSKKQAKEEADKQKKNGNPVGDAINENATDKWFVVYKSFLKIEDAKSDLASIKLINSDAKLFVKKGESTYLEIPITPVVTADTTRPVVTIKTVSKQNIDTIKTTKVISSDVIKVNNSTSDTASKKTNSQPTISTTVVKKFFIIAGSYPNEQMANTEVAALKAKGYTDAEIVGKNDAGNWRICFKSFATREDANAGLPAIKLKNPSAWIFEKK